ncbi:MAG TPA: hypothetical protein VMR66_00560 [Gemmatimonadota bacterium]|nr:hypothetical protein [Gemmatimonadota bacterium]
MTAEASTSAPSSARPFYIAIGVLVLLLIATYAWKVVSVNRAEERMAEAERTWEEGARHAVLENTRSMLALAAVPLGLSAREEAMSRNYGLLEERFERLVREPGVERVLYATAGDSIAVSTDRSLIGRSLDSAVPAQYARPIATNVIVEDGAFHAIVPITGLNERLGVVVLTYRPPAVPVEGASTPGDTTAPVDGGADPAP